MEEFKKPEKIVIDAIPYLTEILGKGIIKDLQEDEIICPICHGTGLAIDDNEYGLSNDTDKSKHFPYKHQSVVGCRNCYNGVLKVCKHCGKPLNRRDYRCECDGAKAERRAKSDKREQDRFDKAVKMTQQEYEEKYPNNMIVYDNEYYTSIDDLLDYLSDDNIEFPIFVWGTNKINIGIDAENAIERAIEDAYEDAYEDAEFGEQAEGELYKFIEEWNKKYSLDCYEENNIAILIPKL